MKQEKVRKAKLCVFRKRRLERFPTTYNSFIFEAPHDR